MSTEPRNLGIRLDTELSARLERFEKRTGVGGVTLGRNAIEAALDYFEKHHKITFPLALVTTDDFPGTYGLNESVKKDEHSPRTTDEGKGGYGPPKKSRCAIKPLVTNTAFYVVQRQGK